MVKKNLVMNKNGLEMLALKVGPSRRSERFQKLLPEIVEKYLNKESLEELKKKSSWKNKKFITEIYRRLDEIKNESSKKIAGSVMKHPKDITEPPVFVDAVIKYCIKNQLEGKLSQCFEKIGIEKDFIARKYKSGEHITGDIEILKDVGKNPRFYGFLMDEIIN